MSRRAMTDDEVVKLVFCIMVLVACSFIGGWMFAGKSWKAEAVKQGHAEYYLDVDANKHWHWITKPVPEDKP